MAINFTSPTPVSTPEGADRTTLFFSAVSARSAVKSNPTRGRQRIFSPQRAQSTRRKNLGFPGRRALRHELVACLKSFFYRRERRVRGEELFLSSLCALWLIRMFVRLLKQAAFGEGHRLALADDEMIEHTHVHQRQRVGEAAGEPAIGVARLGDTRGMVVREDDGSGVPREDARSPRPACRGTAPRTRSCDGAYRGKSSRKPRAGDRAGSQAGTRGSRPGW